MAESFGDLLAGGVGGLANVVAGQPLDTVKVKLQTFPSLYKSSLDCVKKTYFNEGILTGFYAGSSPAYVVSLIENAVLFLVYEYSVNLVKWVTNTKTEKELPTVYHATAGAVACIPATLTYAPMDRVKSLMQVQKEIGQTTERRLSQTGMFRQILANEGVPGFYRGLTSLLSREVPGYFCFFYGYAGSVKLLASPEESRDNMSMWKIALAGGIAGCGFWGIMYPCDVVKARIQVKQELSGSFFRNMSIILKEEIKYKGVRSLYRGLTTTLIRSFPANGALFVTYESTKRLYGDFIHNGVLE